MVVTHVSMRYVCAHWEITGNWFCGCVTFYKYVAFLFQNVCTWIFYTEVTPWQKFATCEDAPSSCGWHQKTDQMGWSQERGWGGSGKWHLPFHNFQPLGFNAIYKLICLFTYQQMIRLSDPLRFSSLMYTQGTDAVYTRHRDSWGLCAVLAFTAHCHSYK